MERGCGKTCRCLSRLLCTFEDTIPAVVLSALPLPKRDRCVVVNRATGAESPSRAQFNVMQCHNLTLADAVVELRERGVVSAPCW